MQEQGSDGEHLAIDARGAKMRMTCLLIASAVLCVGRAGAVEIFKDEDFADATLFQATFDGSRRARIHRGEAQAFTVCKSGR